MNRITRSTMRRLPPRTTVISGAALGLVAGVAVYGAVSSSADVSSQTAFKAKAKAPVATARASAADCAATSKLENGVCVVHVVRTVVVPPSGASIATLAKAAHAEGAKGGLKAAAAKHAAMKKAEKAEEGRHHFGRGSRWSSREDFERDFEDSWTGKGTGTPTPTPTVTTPAPAPVPVPPVPTPVPTTTTLAPVPAPVPAPTPAPTAAS
jgi:hypothetical protein